MYDVITKEEIEEYYALYQEYTSYCALCKIVSAQSFDLDIAELERKRVLLAQQLSDWMDTISIKYHVVFDGTFTLKNGG